MAYIPAQSAITYGRNEMPVVIEETLAGQINVIIVRDTFFPSRFSPVPYVFVFYSLCLIFRPIKTTGYTVNAWLFLPHCCFTVMSFVSALVSYMMMMTMHRPQISHCL